MHVDASRSCQLNAAQSVSLVKEKNWTPFQRQLDVEEGVSQKEPVCSGRLITGKKEPGPERTSGSVDYLDLGLKRLVGRWTI